MKVNRTTKGTGESVVTHEGGAAVRVTSERQLRRTVLACMLWEDSFYESGESIADRICGLIKKVAPEKVAAIAVEARDKQHLRHAPLLITREMARLPEHRSFVADTLAKIIQRPDELTEFLAMYWKEKKQPLSNQVKKGLATAFGKFDEYALAKYNRDEAIKLRDVMFMTHPKPKDKAQEKLWKRLVDGELVTPDTWEVNLSAGKDKKETFMRLISEGKLGAMAFLRNLRNMQEAGVDKMFIKQGMKNLRVEKVLPFRFITAARYAPTLESDLEQLMFKCLAEKEKLSGRTALVVDVSGSMFGTKISAKSELDRFDAAAALAVLLREICEDVDVYTFSNGAVEVPGRRGFALIEAMNRSQAHGGTNLGQSLMQVSTKGKYDRLIVVTDEQSHDRVGAPRCSGQGYMINVGTYQNGVGYGDWVHIDGWSEAIVDYIVQYEQM